MYFRFTGDATLYQQSHYDDDIYVSETELNQVGSLTVSQRSATIGADTPPTVNQQNTPITTYSTPPTEPVISRVGAVGIDSELRDTDVDGANTLDESLPSTSSLPPDTSRRDNIDGGPQEGAVRNQTVGQNSSDASPSNATQEKTRKVKRIYATDSDYEQSKERLRSSSPRYEKEKRYYEDKRNTQDRDSPEQYRDKSYSKRYDVRHEDKRYDDDTDYYSDKERTDRRRKERDDYDRHYGSLRRDKEHERERRRRDYDRDDREYYRYEEDYYSRDMNR